MNTTFEKAYNALFFLRGCDTKHIDDCELIWNAALSTVPDRGEPVAWVNKLDIEALKDGRRLAVTALGTNEFRFGGVPLYLGA